MEESEASRMSGRMSEEERREKALRNRGDVIADSGAIVEPRRVPQMVSVRLDPELVRTLREIAGERGVSLSDILREASERLVASRASIPVFWNAWTIESSTSIAASVRMGTPESSLVERDEAEAAAS